ncbi:Transcription factor Adf-1 ADH distal factor 1 [Channa argus]|uniref:Transcription factor Adf-1 ADH distal factor 1 n=1 Tax=Channa argus TaxID=215402 RepID=A0A6G1QMA9_CHAAH|nr:Transcription factor Adf-1 ADH distal factor 1 [Channa argus]
MEYKLIMAVSGFPSLYDTTSLTYRDLNMRSDAWRQVAEIVGVPESECRRKWKTLRDQHRRERQREKERRESGIGLLNYRPWRYSAILSFLNPFIDARAAGTNGWALDLQPSQIHASEMLGCSTTTETRSDDDETYGIAAADETTTTTLSSSFPDFGQRKRPSPASGDIVRLKEAKTEPTDQPTPPPVLQLDLQPSLHRQAHCSPPPSSATSRLNPLKMEEQDIMVRESLDQTDDEDECEFVSPRSSRIRGRVSDGLLEEYLRRMEAREAHRDRHVDHRDDVTLFLLSLAPAMRRLCTEKQSWVRTKIQQLLHEAEFGATHF